MMTSFLGHSFCANHFWPGLYLLIPLHELFGIVGLLVFQATVVTAGVFPVYYLTLDVTKRKDWATVLGICYLLHPTISIGVLFDFHPELLTIPCLLASFFLANRNRSAWTLTFCIVAMSLYEVTALVYCGFGALLCFHKGSQKLGLTILILSLAYLAVVFFLLMPEFRGVFNVPHLQRWHPLDITMWDLRQICYLLIAIGFTPLLGIRYLIPAIPLLVLLTLSNYNLQMDIRYGYVAPAVPCFFLAAAYGTKRLSSFRRPILRNINRYAPQFVLSLAFLLALYFHLERPIRSQPFSLRPNLNSIRTAAALVPPQASLSTDNHLGAHFSQRRLLLLTPQTGHASGSVDFILADLREDKFKDRHWWETMRSIIAEGEFLPVFFANGIILLQSSQELKASHGRGQLTSEILEYMTQHESMTPANINTPD